MFVECWQPARSQLSPPHALHYSSKLLAVILYMEAVSWIHARDSFAGLTTIFNPMFFNSGN